MPPGLDALFTRPEIEELEGRVASGTLIPANPTSPWVAWAEDTGWQRGGALAWQVYDKNGRPTDERGRIGGGVPVWGLPAIIAEKNGTFTVFH